MKEKNKIIYIDDEPINLQMFAIIFGEDYVVLTADSGAKGLELLEKNKDIKAVISDMNMPEINGIEFIKIAKSKYSNVVFFILTGFDIKDEISTALNNKLINACFTKPYKHKEIDNAIINAISKK